MGLTRSRSRGQASVEFMIALTAVMMIFIVATSFVYFKIVRTLDYKTYVHGTHIANDIAASVNTINRVGAGYSIDMYVPGKLYGDRDYTVSFYRDEPTVFMHGSSFAEGRTLFFSAPLSTSEVYCLLDECLWNCNYSSTEVCWNVTGGSDVRVVNWEGDVYITPPYNLNQTGLKHVVEPFTGSLSENYSVANASVEFLTDPVGSVMYLFEDESSHDLMLVFKHHNIELMMDVNVSISGLSPQVVFSDDKTEFELGREWDGEWDEGIDDGGASGWWDGGTLWLNNSGFRVCVFPRDYPTLNWYWVNPDSSIELDGKEPACITYP